jgi:hypothetical protein
VIRANVATRAPARVPPIVHEVLGSPAHRLDGGARAFLEPRLGHDFGDVRVHTDARAAASARAVGASAYTVGRDVVLGADVPTSGAPRLGLLAHELTHVVQQRGAREAGGGALTIGGAADSLEHEAARVGTAVLAGPAAVRERAPAPLLSRADPAAVRRVMGRGAVVGAGIQLWPTNVVDTVVGRVAGRDRFVRDESARLSVLIGDGLTLRDLARQLLPLWTTATPGVDPVTGVPLLAGMIGRDELARALAVLNRFELPLPSMTQWRSGLRLALPVEIDEATRVATVDPILILTLAGDFQAAWEPRLDQPSTFTIAPTPAQLAQQATDFLTVHTGALARGIALSEQAITNATASRLLVGEVLRRLGTGAFEVALEFMDNLSAGQVNALAAQQYGAEILVEVTRALDSSPGTVTREQQDSLDRANLKLLGRIGIQPRPAPGRACEPGNVRHVAVQPVYFRTAANDPAPTGGSFPGRMAVTREIWAKVGVQFFVSPPVVLDDPVHKTQGSNQAEVVEIIALRAGAGIEVYMVDNDLAWAGGGGTHGKAPTYESRMVISDRGTSPTLIAHEMGHALGLKHPAEGTAHDGDADTIMEATGSHSAPNPRRNTAVNAARMTWPRGIATCIRPDP